MFKFCHFNYDMSWCLPVWVHLVWNPLSFLCLDICYFFMFGMFPAIISWNTFSFHFSLSSPSGTPIMWMLGCLIVSQRSLRLLTIYFFFCCSYWMIFIVLSSRWLMCSVSRSLIFIPSHVFFFYFSYWIIYFWLGFFYTF